MITISAPYDCDVVLRDGSTLHVRPIAPSDASGVLALYRRLSADSLYNRFAARHTPDATEAARLCEATGDDAFALVGERRGELIAIVHYCRDQSSPARAEVAFTVADEFHGRGVATRMLERLSEVARARGIETFEAYVLGSNHQMLQVLAGAGFELRTKVDHGFAQVTLSLAETPTFEERAAARAQASASASMRGFFEPRTVAVVGVSRQRGQIGAEIFRNLAAGGFRGRVVPVNTNAREIESVTAYPTVTAVPGEVDLAVVAVPAACVERVVDDCLAKRVRAIVVISAGFGETGDEGRALEAALLAKVRAAGVRMMGPNCLGLVNTDPAVRLKCDVRSRLSATRPYRLLEPERGAGARDPRLRATAESRHFDLRLGRQQGGRVVERPAPVLGRRSAHRRHPALPRELRESADVQPARAAHWSA